MTGKVVDSDNNFLVLLLPLALIIMILFVAWPFIVAIFIFSLGYKLWQKYRFNQLSEQIDPHFNKLVETNQGSLTILDLTNKTELNAKTARWYLDHKAEEYGAVKRLYENQTVVYYFLTASSLGSILDSSEPVSDTYIEPAAPAKTSPTTATAPPRKKSSSTTATTVVEPKTSSKKTTAKKSTKAKKQEEVKEEAPPVEEKEKLTVNQTELAKRLEVSTSTIAKRKLDRDFSLWCQSRDPEGLPWEYVEETKMFVSS